MFGHLYCYIPWVKTRVWGDLLTMRNIICRRLPWTQRENCVFAACSAPETFHHEWQQPLLRLFSFFFLSFFLFLLLSLSLFLLVGYWLLALLEANALLPHTVMALVDFNRKIFEYVYLPRLIADTLCVQTVPRHAGSSQVLGGDDCWFECLSVLCCSPPTIVLSLCPKGWCSSTWLTCKVKRCIMNMQPHSQTDNHGESHLDQKTN